MTSDPVEVIVLCGASGTGKTSAAFEISAILREKDFSHGLIDADELDRLYPAPDTNLSEPNLAAVWRSFSQHGCRRLVICGVFVSLAENLAWIRSAVGPRTTLSSFRLTASRETRRQRLTQREIGSLLGAHLESSDRAAASLDVNTDGAVPINTDSRSVIEVATEILEHATWL